MAQYVEDEYDERHPKKKRSSKKRRRKVLSDKKRSGSKSSNVKRTGRKGAGKRGARRKQRARKRRRRRMIFGIVAILLAIAISAVIGVGAYKYTYDQADLPLDGKGTIEEPYLIRSVDDLEWLSLQVNGGTEFENVYFQQENDLDFGDHGNWMPIGACDSGYYFRGVYDGKGHSIQNITIDGSRLPGNSKLPGREALRENVGLFGILAGMVCNLTIESGTITGNRIGSIASCGTDRAVIANCYNYASLTATGRCGGIADNFYNGKIIACGNAGALTCSNASWIGGISSYDAGIIYACYSTSPPVSEQFMGAVSVYRTEQVQDVYPGIADESLGRVQRMFADDLKGVELLTMKTGRDTK